MKDNWIDDFVEFTNGLETPPDFRRWIAVSILGAALKKSVWVSLGYSKIYCHLYMFILGESGTGKTEALEAGLTHIVEPLSDLEYLKYEQVRHMTGASLARGFTNSNNSCNDFYAYLPELRSSIHKEQVDKGQVIDYMTDLYDMRSVARLKRAVEGDILSYNACFNMIGSGTMDWMEKCLPKGGIDGGFIGRILFVVLDENTITRKPEIIVTPEQWKLKEPLQMDIADRLIGKDSDSPNIYGEVTLTPLARKLYNDWYVKDWSNIMKNLDDKRLRPYFARKRATVYKIAIILKVSEYDVVSIKELVIDVPDIEKAFTWLKSLETHMATSFGTTELSKMRRQKQAIIKILRRNSSKMERKYLESEGRDEHCFGSQRDIRETVMNMISMDEIVEKDKVCYLKI